MGTSEMKHTLFLTKHFLRLFESCNVLFSGASKFLCFACAHLDRPLAQSRHYCFSKNRARILWALSSSHSAQNSDLLAPKLTQARATLMPLAVILTGWKWKLPNCCPDDYSTEAYIIRVLFKLVFSKRCSFGHLSFKGSSGKDSFHVWS